MNEQLHSGIATIGSNDGQREPKEGGKYPSVSNHFLEEGYFPPALGGKKGESVLIHERKLGGGSAGKGGKECK